MKSLSRRGFRIGLLVLQVRVPSAVYETNQSTKRIIPIIFPLVYKRRVGFAQFVASKINQ